MKHSKFSQCLGVGPLKTEISYRILTLDRQNNLHQVETFSQSINFIGDANVVASVLTAYGVIRVVSDVARCCCTRRAKTQISVGVAQTEASSSPVVASGPVGSDPVELPGKRVWWTHGGVVVHLFEDCKHLQRPNLSRSFCKTCLKRSRSETVEA